VRLLSPQPEPIAFRNFNLCPHCTGRGEQGLLCRLCEGIPMISRSDGKNFHLLLADHPSAYPAERDAVECAKTSVCFWYSHVCDGGPTCSTVVILSDSRASYSKLFRQIESAADLLAGLLASSYRPPTFCELVGNSLMEIAH
jgi:hypothetical protein